MPKDTMGERRACSRGQGTGAVTLAQVAKAAGVSNTTVSYVINGLAEKNGITEATAERVMRVAEQLNYRPNWWARNLVRRRTHTIGALFGNLRNDWAERASVGMRNVLDDEGYLLFVTTHHVDPAIEQQELNTLLQLQVEAVICPALPGSIDVYRQLLSQNVPLVFLENKLVELPEVSFVAWDGEKAAYAGVRHLLEAGRRRIAFLGREYPGGTKSGCYVSWQHSIRYEGYRRAIREANLSLNGTLEEYVLFEEEATTGKVQKMFSNASERPDAIFATLDMSALSAIRDIRQLGLRVPEDVAVVGMGDQPAAGELGAGLTTVRSPDEAMGREAANIALQLIQDPKQAPICRLIESNEIIVRRTSVVNSGPRTKHRESG